MKTFAEYLPTMTERERDIVEQFWSYPCACEMKKAVALMRSTPPAKEPVSVECRVSKVEEASGGAVYFTALLASRSVEIKECDRVRVVKIEEPN